MKRVILISLCLFFLLSCCTTATKESIIHAENLPLTDVVQPELDSPSSVPASTITPYLSATSTEPPSSTPEPTATFTLEPSNTYTPEPSASPSAEPTYAILRGEVIPDKVSCRYGPGAMYLYLYGMNKGAMQDVIGRTDTGQWLLTRSRGDDKACWVKAEFMNMKGDVMSLQMVYPDHFKIPESNQGYRLPWNVVAVRKGDKVVISWESEALRPGDEESATSVLYVVETWVCRNGKLIFTPIGAYTPQVTVPDEPGCSEPSHGRVYFSEKHGYTGPTEINWPGFE